MWVDFCLFMLIEMIIVVVKSWIGIMYEIICFYCDKVFKVDEFGYVEILK